MESWLDSFAQANFLRSGDTAHDLKTPLNVAILNLELLRMRLRKLEVEDEKIAEYMRAIEAELRRLGWIFDAFFVFSTPPKSEGEPSTVDAGPLCSDAAANAGYEIAVDRALPIRVHESRIREAFKLFFEGASHALQQEGRRAEVSYEDGFEVRVIGRPEAAEFEPARIFKFYYTDTTGNPDLSLATARLIAETYGGRLSAREESDKVAICMSFPSGEK